MTDVDRIKGLLEPSTRGMKRRRAFRSGAMSALVMVAGVPAATAQTAAEGLRDDAANTPDISWLNSDRYLGCMVNLGSYVVNDPPQRWTKVNLVTDVAVRLPEARNPKQRFAEILETFQNYNPRALVGTYFSAHRVDESIQQYPRQAVLRSAIPKEWVRPGTRGVDLSDPDAAEGFAQIIISEGQRRNRPILYLDNVIHPNVLEGWVEWKDTCNFLRKVRQDLHESGTLLMANIATVVWGMSEEDVDQLGQAVDGMTFEQGFHWRARGKQQAATRHIDIYRKWLSADKIVVLIPVVQKGPKTEGHKEREARFNAGFAMIVRQPGDRLFVPWAHWGTEPAWVHWPARLGRPISDYTFTEHGLITRKFENGRVTLDPANVGVEVWWDR